MANGAILTGLALGTFTTSGVGTKVPLGQDVGEYITALVRITAASGTTPSLTVTLQWSHDGTNWADADGTPDSMAAATVAGATAKQFLVKGPFVRISYAIAGTIPSFTFSATLYVTD